MGNSKINNVKTRSDIYKKNLAALERTDPLLYSRLAALDSPGDVYQFRESRSGETVPVWAAGEKPLHSLVDPGKEARRLMDSAAGGSFVVLLGLGGVFHCEAALEREGTECLMVIEYNIKGLAGLLSRLDYSGVFEDPRFHLLTDPSPFETEDFFLNLYKPALYGGFKTIPLRSRIVFDNEKFTAAAKALENAVEKISADYSVQAHFGLRWFSNILRNLEKAGEVIPPLRPVRKAAVCGAGPSLDIQIPLLKEKRKELFLIATDTSLPALMSCSIKPDAVISIDCQHISYNHFTETLPDDVSLFLDLASPPLIASRSARPRFFSGGHPLCRYISQTWRRLPAVDTSGGNVTYAAVSLAAALGAVSIELYGADFSYPAGICYARGTYIHRIFQNRQTRLKSLESLYSSFLYRTPLEKKGNPLRWYYETESLRFYREYLESQNPALNAALFPAGGLGAPLENNTAKGKTGLPSDAGNFFSEYGAPSEKFRDFLSRYREKIKSLSIQTGKNARAENSGGENTALLNTLLPVMAAIRRGTGDSDPGIEKITEELKAYCIGEIDSVLAEKPAVF